jgi:adenine-specific DNA-methyltransferase
MGDGRAGRSSPGSRRIAEALDVLSALGVPREQQNERSALTLLALLGLTPRRDWADAEAPLLGITDMMDRFRKHFGKRYAPNTRETVRRYTVHQFVQMGMVVANPDDATRPVNSPDNRYQITLALIECLRDYGSPVWAKSLERYVRKAGGELRRLVGRERVMPLIPVRLPDGRELMLTAGGQNELVKKIVEDFCPRFTPGGVLVYVGDTGDKHRLEEPGYLARLGVDIDEHGKMPDLVVDLADRGWLVLIEAVTSHGPISLKRHNELKELFRGAKAGLVFVTAFMDRRTMAKYVGEIAWETEVWIAESPSHLVHFNGERFLGPYRA